VNYSSGKCYSVAAVVAVFAAAATVYNPQFPARYQRINGVAFSSPQRVVAVGGKGLVVQSDNAGQSWQSVLVDERKGNPFYQDQDLYDVQFASGGKVGWIVGENGLILHTGDGGHTWDRQESNSDARLFKVAAINDHEAAAIGNRDTLWTNDGGAHWHVNRFPVDLIFFDIFFIGHEGWIAGEFETVLHSVDGGQTWQVLRGGKHISFTSGPYFAVTFKDSSHGWVTGMEGQVMQTDDGGKTWRALQGTGNADLYVLNVVGNGDSSSLWVAGDQGKAFKLQDKMVSPVAMPTNSSIVGMAFNGQTGFAVGTGGTMLRSTDGGSTWSAVH
jgi:photosystem II stability/assembly factor-like uncharacterized protein